jgi:hypothetical protein
MNTSQHLQMALAETKEDRINAHNIIPTVNRMIEANNRRALEMLLRIQSQVEANTVVSITSKKESTYE